MAEHEHALVSLEAQRILEQLLTELQGDTDRQRGLADLSRAELGRQLAAADPHRDHTDPPGSPVRLWQAEVDRIVAALEAEPLPTQAEPWAVEG